MRRRRPQSQFARTVAARNPEVAVQLVDDVTDDQERDRLLRGLLPPLAETLAGAGRALGGESHGRGAADALDRRSRQRLGAVRSAGSAQVDPVARDGPAKDQALTTSSFSSGADPSTTCSPIINQIQTPERRSHAVLMAAMRLSQNDMDSARTLLRRYPLDPARQRQFDDFVRSGAAGASEFVDVSRSVERARARRPSDSRWRDDALAFAAARRRSGAAHRRGHAGTRRLRRAHRRRSALARRSRSEAASAGAQCARRALSPDLFARRATRCSGHRSPASARRKCGSARCWSTRVRN